MKAKFLGIWSGIVTSYEFEEYGFKSKSAAKRFMRNLGFKGRHVVIDGCDDTSYEYHEKKLAFGRFFPASYVPDYKYIAHIRRK